MALFRKRRRFAECFEFDRADDARSGTPEHQAAIRRDLELFMDYGGPLHRVIQALDRAINRRYVHYINITFGEGSMPFANPSQIWMNWTFDPELNAVYFWHELGHVVGMNVFNPQDRSEGWAEEFKQWVYNGCPTDHPVWLRLEPLV